MQSASASKTLQKIIRQRYLLLMVIPGILVMLLFNFYPAYFAQIAFRSYKVTLGTDVLRAPYVGFVHFAEFFRSPDFGNVMLNTVGISFFKLLFGFPIPILFAILLSEIPLLRFKKIVQSVTYLPHFLSWVIISAILLIWLSDTGFVTGLAYRLGLIPSQSNMLANPHNFWGIAVVSEIWKEFGWNSIIYLAAITSIDQEMFEAARVDGAGKLRQILNITLPSIAPTISLMLILSISGLFSSNFDQIFVLKNPVNAPRANVIDTLVYQYAFTSNRYDYATAVGLLRSVVSALLLFAANQSSKVLNGNSLF
jgi:putative aldouronate transport system permease protein